VFDFTDSANAVEIAYFDRGPIDAERLVIGGYWSTYWFNGYVYGSEIARGLDVLRLLPSEYLSPDELAAANLVKFQEFNAQHQPKLTWPASFVVAKAYLDQLVRSKAVPAERAQAAKGLMDLAEKATGAQRGRATAELTSMAQAYAKQAGSAGVQDAKRLRALAETIQARLAELR
jgi:hypothetical protein